MTPNRSQIAQEASKLLPNLILNLAWNSTSNFHFSSHFLADVRLNRESGDMRFVSQNTVFSAGRVLCDETVSHEFQRDDALKTSCKN